MKRASMVLRTIRILAAQNTALTVNGKLRSLTVLSQWEWAAPLGGNHQSRDNAVQRAPVKPSQGRKYPTAMNRNRTNNFARKSAHSLDAAAKIDAQQGKDPAAATIVKCPRNRPDRRWWEKARAATCLFRQSTRRFVPTDSSASLQKL